jgi:hypothetical protein
MPGIKQFAASKTARFLKWCACAGLLVIGVNYCFDAALRARAGTYSDGWQTEVSKTHDGAYTARYAFIRRDKILLRLYRTDDSRVLAERTFTEHGVGLVWADDALIYDTSEDPGMIMLPPTRLDWLLAKLP